MLVRIQTDFSKMQLMNIETAVGRSKEAFKNLTHIGKCKGKVS